MIISVTSPYFFFYGRVLRSTAAKYMKQCQYHKNRMNPANCQLQSINILWTSAILQLLSFMVFISYRMKRKFLSKEKKEKGDLNRV